MNICSFHTHEECSEKVITYCDHSISKQRALNYGFVENVMINIPHTDNQLQIEGIYSIFTNTDEIQSTRLKTFLSINTS